MLANLRTYFPLFVTVALLSAWLPVAAQVHGVPPSVTSFGFGGSNNPTPGIRASVTSLGPYGYGSSAPFLGNCCGSFFWQPGYWPFSPNLPLRSERHHHHDATIVPLITPVYVPYAVPYGGDADDDTAEDNADAYASGPGAAKREEPRPPARRGVGDDSAPSGAASKETAPPAQPEEPVAAQPSTILVFKDGHKSEVVNYAIIGNTLFDFAGGRTHKILLADLDLPATQKANEEQGVEFKLPPTSK